ncbi:MAG TPA: menaquinone biosynthesis protein [Tepidisphaeraceae bacterium]|nr:menaquinone biosynthesis protein [Tepidisphaeraceae bacterium]
MHEATDRGRAGLLRVACVSFLNSRPLIWGLEQDPGIELLLDVPARLIDRLRDATADVALLPSIDYQRLPGLRIVPSGGIGCDGHTLTVRIFSRRPMEQIRRLACDPDSHTSVALARIILAERYGVRPEFVELTRIGGTDEQARLLIGDKVVCEEPAGFEHQYDLGDEWKQLTGLPFVFAVWMARPEAELGDLPVRLERAKQAGRQRVEQIIRQWALPRGWPAHLARQYLTEYLKYDIGPAQLRAMARFYELAARHGVIDSPVPLRVYGAD